MSEKIHTYLNINPANWNLIIGLFIALAIAFTMTGEFRQKYPQEWVGRAAGVGIRPTSSLALPDYFQRDAE